MTAHTVNRQPQVTPMPEQQPDVRVGNFEEVALGYTADQAVNEAQRCLNCKDAPCVSACPVGVDIPAFVCSIAEGDFADAHSIVRADNALPAICGRVCPQETQCQGMCTRGKKGDAVGIGRLERFVADWAIAHPDELVLSDSAATDSAVDISGRKVALIGSGPASLTCAAQLAAAGVQVTVFEALHKAGGVLVYGIPEFRLPNSLVDSEVASLVEAGADIRVDTVIGKLFTIDELMSDKGYDAVFVGTGAGLPRYLSIPGEALNGVCVANELLTRVNLMRGYEFPRYGTPVYAGEKCAVIGGGNVAMDAARTARRLGADVTVVYRRGMDEMPARAEEVAHAQEEGVEFLTLANPIEAIGDENGWVSAVNCQKMRLGEPDEDGRRRPEPVEGEIIEVPCDMLVIAIGSRTNPLIAQTTQGLNSTDRDLIAADERTGQTSRAGVFAGGDATTGAATVIEAMGAGKRAAAGIIEYLEAL